MKSARERWLKLTSAVRAWRCDECGTRQLSDGRPSRRTKSGEAQVTDGPAPLPQVAGTEPVASSARPRRRKRDPLAEKIRWRRRKRLLLTVLLVVATGIVAGWLVIRSHGPSTAEITEIQ